MRNTFLRLAMASFVACMLCATTAMAGVEAGQTINKSNVQNIQGMVPDFIYNLVADGQMTMKIGKLDINKKEYFFPSVLNNWESNKGKYGLDEKNHLIEVASGKKYPRVDGIPFPDLDPADPKFGYKASYNWRALDSSEGNIVTTNSMVDVDSGKMQRECVQEQYIYRPKAGQTLEEYEWLTAGAYKKPYDVSGLAVLDMLTINPEGDRVRYVYMPGLRKLRRMNATPPTSNTSQGWSYAEDDLTFAGPIYDIPAADFKVMGVKEMLIPFVSDKPIQTTQDQTTGASAVVVNSAAEGVILGAASGQTDVADWVPTNVVWVKAKVLHLETTPKVDSYQFSKMDGWMDLETGRPVYKVDYDQNGGALKYVLHVNGAYTSSNWKNIMYAAIIAKETGRPHATMVSRMGMPGNKIVFDIDKEKMNLSLYTKEGFAKMTQ